MGTGAAWKDIPNQLKDGTNGCIIPKELINKEFTISFHSQDAMLDVYIGDKARTMTTCVKGFFSEVLHQKGYLGVTARNT